MQPIDRLEITPNHTLKRLIVAWSHHHKATAAEPPPSDELVTILGTIDTTPFKVTCLRKLRSIVETGDVKKDDFKISGGVEILARIMTQILVENVDFTTIRACEEALGVLHHVQFSDEDEEILQILMNPNFIKSTTVLLQRGSSEAKFFAISTFQKITKANHGILRKIRASISSNCCWKWHRMNTAQNTSSLTLKLLILNGEEIEAESD
ncbi:hypothetical protein ACS0TY_003434 [Phlomoides rotata]